MKDDCFMSKFFASKNSKNRGCFLRVSVPMDWRHSRLAVNKFVFLTLTFNCFSVILQLTAKLSLQKSVVPKVHN